MSSGPLRELEQAEGYIAGICFKTGPPILIGIELEWTVHYIDNPGRPLETAVLASALHPHTPSTLDAQAAPVPLPSGTALTAEPGGQVEISPQPARSLTALHATVTADLDYLTALLAQAGLRLGKTAVDPWRTPRRLLRTPRYNAMAAAFEEYGPHGATMMCSTAALQVCLDAGLPERLPARWAAIHAVGPVLLALFANSPRHAGRDTGWASTRMRCWLGMDPARTAAIPVTGDPVTHWAGYALRAPVLGRLHAGQPVPVPAGISFADWIGGALPGAPTVADLDFHLSTLFPPVRPRGYLEVRYLDAQPPGEWIVPVAVLAALFADEATVDGVRELCGPVAGRWHDAARLGLADRRLASTAREVAGLTFSRLAGTGLPREIQHEVHEVVNRRLAAGGGRQP